MNVLIVLAHPEPKSFNGAMKDAAVETLERAGHTVIVSDLYAQKFNPVAGPWDVTKQQNTEVFNLAMEQDHAAENNLFANDIQVEIDKVKAADFLLLQFPMWWYSMPAILKGWVDRVLAYKVAYGLGDWWDNGPFQGRRAMISITAGVSATAFYPDGRNGDIERLLWPMTAGTLRICGYDVLPPFISYSVPWISDEGRQEILDRYQTRLLKLETMTPLSFHTLDQFGEDSRLLPNIEPKTPMQHRGPYLKWYGND
jgi:NAD(P)H dehydrogenase (quinone)